METDKDSDTLAYGGVLCDIFGYHSGVAEVSSLLRYYVVSVSFKLLFQQFLRTVRPRLRRQCEPSKLHKQQPHQRKIRSQKTWNYQVLWNEGRIWVKVRKKEKFFTVQCCRSSSCGARNFVTRISFLDSCF